MILPSDTYVRIKLLGHWVCHHAKLERFHLQCQCPSAQCQLHLNNHMLIAFMTYTVSNNMSVSLLQRLADTQIRQTACQIRQYVFECCKRFWSCIHLWTATCLHSVSYTMLFFWHPHEDNPMVQMQNSWLSHFLLLWTPHLEFIPTRPYRHCSTLSSFKTTQKTFLFSQYFRPN